MGKDMTYFNLLEAMEDNCCPICNLINKQTVQMMDGFLYEGVNDIKNRKNILESRGFCDFHSRMLINMGDPLDHAIIYTDLINLLIKDIEKEDFSKYVKNKGCIFCDEAKKCENNYISAFAQGFSESEFKEKYRSCGMLCIKHLNLIYKNYKSIYPLIEKETILKYQELLGYLEEIRRKSDYRFSSEKWSDGAKEAWKRAVEVINGKV